MSDFDKIRQLVYLAGRTRNYEDANMRVRQILMLAGGTVPPVQSIAEIEDLRKMIAQWEHDYELDMNPSGIGIKWHKNSDAGGKRIKDIKALYDKIINERLGALTSEAIATRAPAAGHSVASDTNAELIKNMSTQARTLSQMLGLVADAWETEDPNKLTQINKNGWTHKQLLDGTANFRGLKQIINDIEKMHGAR